MSEPSEAAPAEDTLVDAVGAAALPPEHDLIGAQVLPEAALLGDANEQFWEAPIFARMTTIAAQADPDNGAVSTENILSWSKPHYKGLSIYFSPEYKPSDETSWSRLKDDLQESAAEQGFSLVSKGAKGKSPADRLRHVLICARGRTVPQSRKASQSLRPTELAECCRFRLTIHQDLDLDRYFIKGGQNNGMHKFHVKMTPDACRPKKKRARHGDIHSPIAQAAQRQPDVAAPAPLANVVWHPTSLTRADRWKNHKGAVLWFTGLSACGKSSVANQVEVFLSQRDIKTYLLDGDNLRHGLCSDLAFSEAERNENLRRTAEVAKLMADSGTVVLAAFVSPYESHRERVKSIVVAGEIPFVEIYVKASLETCEKRDPKGLYLKARSGQIPNFTGISQPYEEPTNPDIVLDADTKTIQTLALQVVHYLDTTIHGSLVVANENGQQLHVQHV